MIELAQAQYLWILAVIPLLFVTYGLYRNYGKECSGGLETLSCWNLLCLPFPPPRMVENQFVFTGFVLFCTRSGTSAYGGKW